MFKKILISFFLVLTLSSCFGGDSESLGSDSGLTLYENDGYSMFVPASWELIENKDDILPKPAGANIELAVTSKKSMEGFYNNLLVLSEDLGVKETTSTEYSFLNHNSTKDEYDTYMLLNQKNLEISEGNTTNIYTFQARYNKNTPKVSFLQMGVVCPDNKGYVVTLGLSLQVKDFSRYENILKTFSCK